MKMKHAVLIAFAVMAVMTMSCAKNRKAYGMMDDPQTHTLQGMKYWDKQNYAQARDEFKLAISLEEGKKYCPAWAGLAMTDAAEGKFKDAEDNADKAVSLCGAKGYQGHMAAAIVIEYKYKGDKENAEWWKDAQAEYRKAIEIDPKSGELFYRAGHMYKLGYEFQLSEDAFRKNLELKNGYEEEANKEWAVVQKIVRAEPGTRVGKRIALDEKITRADIAALFMTELDLDKILDKSKAKNYETSFTAPADPRQFSADSNVKKAAILDCDSSWARNFIQDVQKYRIRGLEPNADHKFYPDALISRGEYALFIEDILMAITGDRTLATKYVGSSESRFPDVNPSSPYYNAICNSVDKNIMSADLTGEFHAQDPVSGPDALLIIRAIKDLRR